MMLSDVPECVRGRGREYKEKGKDKEQTRGKKESKERGRMRKREREREGQVPKSGWPKATSLPLPGTESVQMTED